MRSVATGCGPSNLQNKASLARSFLHFLAGRDAVPTGLDLWTDSPRAPLSVRLTDEAGAAPADYLRHSRPPPTHLAVFLGLRRPLRSLPASGIFRRVTKLAARQPPRRRQ